MFLLVVLFLLCVNYSLARGALTKGVPTHKRLIAFSHFLTAQAFTTAFIFTVVTLGRWLDWLVAGVLVLGAGSVFLFGRYLIVASGPRDRSFLRWRTGLALWAAISGCYMTYTALDHWLFWSHAGSGVADTATLGVEDVSCEKLVLVNMRGDTANWRCPIDIAIGNVQSGQVFSPWPSYTSGDSRELQRALSAVLSTGTAAH